MEENDIELVSKKYNSNFVNHEKQPCVYTIKDISEAVYTKSDNKGTLQNEYDDVNMKPKLIFSLFVMLRVNEKSFLNTFLGFASALQTY